MSHTIPTFGSRIQVYRGHAKKTSGGLTKSHLMMNKHGRVVSKAKHLTAKKEMRLLKHGYGTKKGKFGYVKVGSKKSKSRKMKGGMNTLSPSELESETSMMAGGGSGMARAMAGGSGLRGMLGMAGGSKYRAMAGGSGMVPMLSQGSANWAGDGIDGAGLTDFGDNSTSVQLRSGMAGGKRRRLSKRQGRSRGFLAMSGGTTSQRAPLNPSDLGSVDVQMRAGLGN